MRVICVDVQGIADGFRWPGPLVQQSADADSGYGLSEEPSSGVWGIAQAAVDPACNEFGDVCTTVLCVCTVAAVVAFSTMIARLSVRLFGALIACDKLVVF